MAESWDSGTRDSVKKIPLLKASLDHTWTEQDASPMPLPCCAVSSWCLFLFLAAMTPALSNVRSDRVSAAVQTKAGPREKEEWGQRLKEVSQLSTWLMHYIHCAFCLEQVAALVSLHASVTLKQDKPSSKAAIAGAASPDQIHSTEQSNRL